MSIDASMPTIAQSKGLWANTTAIPSAMATITMERSLSCIGCPRSSRVGRQAIATRRRGELAARSCIVQFVVRIMLRRPWRVRDQSFRFTLRSPAVARSAGPLIQSPSGFLGAVSGGRSRPRPGLPRERCAMKTAARDRRYPSGPKPRLGSMEHSNPLFGFQ